MIKYHLPIILSSSTGSGAINKSSDGSSFQVTLEKGLIIPTSAKYCWVVCQSAQIWNTSPNISDNNNRVLYTDPDVGTITIVIPQGLYDISLLNAEINRQIDEAGGMDDAFVIIANDATQKTIIKLKSIGSVVDFTTPQSINDLLGFDSVVLTSTAEDELFDSQNVASFNNIDYFIIHTDLITHGIRINNKYSQSVAQVLISAPTGSLIVYQPQNPPEIPSNELIGNKKNIINVWLTDQDNKRVDTAKENYSMRLMIYYLE